MALSVDFICS